MNDNITPDHDGSPVPDTPASTTTQRRAMLAGMAGIAAGALLTRGAKAGPLNPPAGPVTSTGKTLLEIEPRRAINASNTPGNPFAVFRISQPGSYYLTANAFGEPSKRIIEIVTNNVTIDLNGFEVRGVAGGFEGIRAVLSATENIVVRNGIVRNASLGSPSTAAVDLSAVRSARVEDLIVAGSGTAGIETGPEGVVARCAARDCAGRGVFVGKSSLVERVLAVGNGADGIWTDDNTIVQDCVCEDNTMSGISVSPPVGFSTGSNCSVLNCIARGNGTFGVYGGNTCTIRDCSASNNGSNGFDVSNSCTITGAAARSNSANGIRVKNGCTITACTAESNSTSGILADFSCVISHCTAGANGSSGIFISNASCTVSDCIVRANEFNGIRVGTSCTVRNNLCENNGPGTSAAGIFAFNIRNTIDSNTCIGNGRGIWCDSGLNFITRNTCSGNGLNWLIATENRCLVVNSVPAIGFSGNSGGTSPGSTNPNANFTY